MKNSELGKLKAFALPLDRDAFLKSLRFGFQVPLESCSERRRDLAPGSDACVHEGCRRRMDRCLLVART